MKSHLRKKYTMTSKSSSWRQQVCHDVKSYVIASKLHHDVKNTSVRTESKSWSQSYIIMSWRQKVHNFVKNTSWCQCSSWRQKVRHDINKYIMMLKVMEVKVMSWRQKVRYHVKKYVIMSKSTLSHQKVR